MRTHLKHLVQRLLRRQGVDLVRYSPHHSPAARLTKLLETHGVDLVLDVGANVGQFATRLRTHGYRGGILSYEPQAGAHAQLQAAAAADPGWEVAPRMALGERAGTTTLNVSANTSSSSVLPMLEAHTAAHPAARYVASEEVPLRRLDDAVGERLAGRTVFLKVDAQGYEREVLAGAAETLTRVVGLELELSLVPLYEGQELYLELIQRLAGLGFELHAVDPGFTDPRTGRLLQMDGVFFRR